MREVADADRLRRLLVTLGRAADRETAIYLTGGATAVLIGWRPTTIDADILMVPESDALLRAGGVGLNVALDEAASKRFVIRLSCRGGATVSTGTTTPGDAGRACLPAR